MIIRSATINDAILDLDPAIAQSPDRREALAALVAAGGVLIADDNGLVGFAAHDTSFFNRPFLALLFVVPVARRQGVASRLVAAVEATVAGTELFTSTNRSNLPMQALCARLGYQVSGNVDNLDPSDPEIIYYKALETERGDRTIET